MKRVMFCVLTALVIAVTTQGAEPKQKPDQKKLAQLAERYLQSLTSDNYGVRKSALYHLAKLHALEPSLDLTNVADQIRKMSRSDAEPLLRIQAGLTLVYLNDKILTEKIKPEDQNDSTDFYNKIHVALAGRW